MSFLYPQFLFALAAIAIPIAIHLFNFQKPKKVMFTNVRFLRDVQASTSSNLQLKHLLVLLARVLFIAFLVFAFAQPFFKKQQDDANAGARHVSIYLDNSYSMQGGSQTGNLLDMGATMAEEISRIYPENTLYHFITNTFEGKSQYFVSQDKLREALTEVKFANNYREAEAVYKRQQSAFQTAAVPAGGDLFWFSDFQKSNVGAIEALDIDSTKTLHLVPMAQTGVSNVYIDSLWLDSPFFKASANNSLKVKVVNGGKEDVSDIILKLFVEDVQVSTASLNLPAGTTQDASFTFTVNDNAVKKCRVTIEDYPVVFDNEYYFVLKNAPEIRVMHVWQNQTPYVTNVFSNEALFNINSYNYKNINFDQFTKSDLIVLEGVETFDVALTEAINKALRNGQSVAVFPAVRPDAASYNSMLVANGAGTVELVKNDSLSTGITQQLAVPDLRNPFYEGVFENASSPNTTMPFANRVLKWNQPGQKILTYKGGSSFLSQYRRGGGQLYVFASPLNDDYTNLHRNATIFLPVMYRMAMLSVNNSEKLAFTFQEPALSVEVGDVAADRVFKLVKGDMEIIPEQRVADRRLVMSLPKIDMEPGFYDLKQDGQTLTTLAFNYDKGESAFDFYTEEELAALFANKPNIKVYQEATRGEFARDLQSQQVGTPLWKYALMAALFFLLAEVLLIRLWRTNPVAKVKQKA
jgi:hypothetical protein